MKQLNKMILLAMFMSMVSISAKAQQTSMTIDNQSPGWLSSKIGYGDQQTVENLKITGYLNGTDFNFLIDLDNNQKLRTLDLSDANIVHGGDPIIFRNDPHNNIYDDTKTEDNVVRRLFDKFSNLQKLLTPKSVTEFSSKLQIDSVILYGQFNMVSIAYNNRMNYLELTEGLDSVSLRDNGSYSTIQPWRSMKKLILPSTLTLLANLKLDQSCKGNIVSKIEHPELLSFINCNIGGGDTIFVPRGTTERYKQTQFNVFKNIVELAPPTSINLNKTFLKLYKEEKAPLSVSLIPADAYYKGLVWESTDENVVSVSQTGEVVAMGYGTASVIVCSDKDESIADTCIVNVYEHTAGVSISNSTIELNIGSSTELSVNTLPLETSDNEINWSSSNEEIAIVDGNGKVTALNVGACVITATAVDGGSKAECVVTVVQPAKSLSLTKHTTSIRVGNMEELRAVVSPDNTADKSVSWSSRNSEIADVSDIGVVTAKKGGKTFIVAWANSNPNAKDSCEVTVLQPVTGVSVSDESLSFDGIGSVKQLSATVQPEDASDKSVRWESSNTAVCTVSSSGIVVAVGVGVSVVYVTTVDGGYVAVCIVTVKESDGIMTIDVDALTGNETIYDVQGKRISKLQHGINIIRMTDGTTRKVVVE